MKDGDSFCSHSSTLNYSKFTRSRELPSLCSHAVANVGEIRTTMNSAQEDRSILATVTHAFSKSGMRCARCPALRLVYPDVSLAVASPVPDLPPSSFDRRLLVGSPNPISSLVSRRISGSLILRVCAPFRVPPVVPGLSAPSVAVPCCLCTLSG